jgi:hypothetical protein
MSLAATRYYIYTIVVTLVVVSTSFWFGSQLGPSDRNLIVAIVLSGGCGGILFAVRESILTWPELHGSSIHLGWLADCAYGIAGAFAVFLLVPGLSESASEGFKELFAVPAAVKANTTNGMDLIEVIAVALVGGFGGRSVMRHAERRVLSKESATEPGDGQETNTIEMQTRAVNEDIEAQRLVRDVVDPAIESPSNEEISQGIVTASLTAQQIAFEFVEHYVDVTTGEDIGPAVMHLSATIEGSEFGQNNHSVSAFHAKLLAQQEQWLEAVVTMTHAIKMIMRTDPSDRDTRREYESFCEFCSTNVNLSNTSQVEATTSG